MSSSRRDSRNAEAGNANHPNHVTIELAVVAIPEMLRRTTSETVTGGVWVLAVVAIPEMLRRSDDKDTVIGILNA